MIVTRSFAMGTVVAALIACGGSTSTVSDAGAVDSSSTDGASFDGGACVNATEGAACSTGQVSCDRVDLCCASALSCDGTTKTWKLQGMACLLCQTHACGGLTCQGNQMCVSRASGVPVEGGSGTSYECDPYPSACARQWTCGCVEKNLPVGCTLSPNGCDDKTLPVKLSCMGA